MQTESSRPRSAGARRADALLVVVVAASIVLATGAVVEDAGTVPAGSFARVNGEALPAAQLDAILSRLGDQAGQPPGDAERREVISRLVDEELLLQQGLALGLVRADTRLRSQLIQEVIRQATAESAASPVEDAELRDFLQRNAGYFRRPDTFRIEGYRFASASHAGRAAEGDAAALASGSRDTTLPETALTEARWRDHLGSSLAARIVSLPEGGLFLADGARVFRLAGRSAGGVPGFAEIRPQVEAEFRRRRDEDALRRYVARLREDARIVTQGGDAGP